MLLFKIQDYSGLLPPPWRISSYIYLDDTHTQKCNGWPGAGEETRDLNLIGKVCVCVRHWFCSDVGRAGSHMPNPVTPGLSTQAFFHFDLLEGFSECGSFIEIILSMRLIMLHLLEAGQPSPSLSRLVLAAHTWPLTIHTGVEASCRLDELHCSEAGLMNASEAGWSLDTLTRCWLFYKVVVKLEHPQNILLRYFQTNPALLWFNTSCMDCLIWRFFFLVGVNVRDLPKVDNSLSTQT